MQAVFQTLKINNIKRNLSPKNWNFNFYKNTGARTEEEFEDPDLDPHYKLMAAYNDVPQWWYGAFLIISVVVALVCIYKLESTLPWWGFLIALLISYLLTMFTGVSMYKADCYTRLCMEFLAFPCPFSLLCRWLEATFTLEDLWPTCTSLSLATTLSTKRSGYYVTSSLLSMLT